MRRLRHSMIALIAASAVISLALSRVAAGQDDDPPDYSRKGADTCLACHEEPSSLSVFSTPHGRAGEPESPFGSGNLQCEACHGPGDAHSARVRRGQERPPMPYFGGAESDTVELRNAMCSACHANDTGSGWHAGPHDTDETACVDCHQVHAPSDPVLATHTQPAVCFDCHRLQRNESQKAFSHPFLEGEMACTGCHSPHGDASATTFARQTVNDTCYSCHAEKRGPYLWEHAPVSEDCGLCHSPHGSNHPGMLTRRAPLLCQGCHSQAGHPSMALEDGGLATGSPSQFLLGRSCMNCHEQVHGSNHPSGSKLAR